MGGSHSNEGMKAVGSFQHIAVPRQREGVNSTARRETPQYNTLRSGRVPNSDEFQVGGHGNSQTQLARTQLFTPGDPASLGQPTVVRNSKTSIEARKEAAASVHIDPSTNEISPGVEAKQ